MNKAWTHGVTLHVCNFCGWNIKYNVTVYKYKSSGVDVDQCRRWWKGEEPSSNSKFVARAFQGRTHNKVLKLSAMFPAMLPCMSRLLRSRYTMQYRAQHRFYPCKFFRAWHYMYVFFPSTLFHCVICICFDWPDVITLVYDTIYILYYLLTASDNEGSRYFSEETNGPFRTNTWGLKQQLGRSYCSDVNISKHFLVFTTQSLPFRLLSLVLFVLNA